MSDIAYRPGTVLNNGLLRIAVPVLLVIVSIGINLTLLSRVQAYTPDTAVFTDSTLGELAMWMAAQSEEEAPVSLFGQLAKAQAVQQGADQLDPAILLHQAQVIQLGWLYLTIILSSIGVIGLITRIKWGRYALIAALLLTITLLFNIPVTEGDNSVILVLLSSFVLIGSLIFSPGPATKILGFVVVLALILLAWETSKFFAASVNYRITTPVDSWSYETYPSLETAFIALENNELDAVIADRNDIRDIIPPFPADSEIDPSTLPYPTLRYHTALDTNDAVLGYLPVTPQYPGRLSVITPAESSINHLRELTTRRVGAVDGDFADTNYLSLERNLLLLDLKIANDINLPHLQSIAEAFLQPARRNGPLLLIRILSEAALHTWSEAILGFVIGASLGFVLGTVFTHFAPLERGMLPYVVASQTVPILAIAPMVVIWLGAGPISVAVISAYLTFFPVTINTLRGLRSPHPNALELMHSYAASQWEIMWKLRFRAALPYIFTALKVSATASVVGAIIGELPSSIRSGLGRAILDFSSDYSLVSTPKLWAAIMIAASIGILSFLIVSAVEALVLRKQVRSQ